MKNLLLLLPLITLISITAKANSTDLWIGNVKTHISRAAENACFGHDQRDFNENAIIVYDGWVRSRAVARAICFEAWRNDFENNEVTFPNVWVSFESSGKKYHSLATIVGKRGNNIIYKIELDKFDPFYINPSIRFENEEVIFDVTISTPSMAHELKYQVKYTSH